MWIFIKNGFLFVLFSNYVQILSDFNTFEKKNPTRSRDNVLTAVESLIHILFDRNIENTDNLISEVVRLSLKKCWSIRYTNFTVIKPLISLTVVYDCYFAVISSKVGLF